MVFVTPVYEPLPNQYIVKVLNDTYLGAESVTPVSFKRLILPELEPPHTDLLSLKPLPVTALSEPRFEELYNFTHFNPIQTQIFHSLYHQDVNILLGAPTGSGKTVAAELAILRVFSKTPKMKVRNVSLKPCIYGIICYSGIETQ
ncbi:unnamed protein product [Protopolystoma xenopodis]|uniref:DEAD/DEAH-box helicase domain-containing protein n=1 Tax=Protopolystoma xenopodis TaxID=117903 RepID=A0A448XCA0_9PLAT|nr:unnamed protein product [Protopolystoma xenopodis]